MTVEIAPAVRKSTRNRLFKQDHRISHVASVGDVFDLSGELEPFIDVCRDPEGLADAIGMLTALADGPARSAGFEKALYVIQVADDPICKIGISANPLKRITDLQGAHYRELFLYGVIFCPTRKAMTIEQSVLDRASREGNRLFGEWVSDEPQAVMMKALEAARDHKIDICDGKLWFRNMVARTKEIHRQEVRSRVMRQQFNQGQRA